jgi:ATF/CREB family transcription factor
MSEEPDDEDDGMDGMDGMDGDRKMTDEEKRKNFLERNRYVVLQCCNG